MGTGQSSRWAHRVRAVTAPLGSGVRCELCPLQDKAFLLPQSRPEVRVSEGWARGKGLSGAGERLEGGR